MTEEDEIHAELLRRVDRLQDRIRDYESGCRAFLVLYGRSRISTSSKLMVFRHFLLDVRRLVGEVARTYWGPLEEQVDNAKLCVFKTGVRLYARFGLKEDRRPPVHYPKACLEACLALKDVLVAVQQSLDEKPKKRRRQAR